MKDRPILKIALALTLLLEIVLVVGVYQVIGPERLIGQTIRIIIQLLLILFIIFQSSNRALFILTAYHILNGLIGFSMENPSISIYHVVIGCVIYFHEELENRFLPKNKTVDKSKSLK